MVRMEMLPFVLNLSLSLGWILNTAIPLGTKNKTNSSGGRESWGLYYSMKLN